MYVEREPVKELDLRQETLGRLPTGKRHVSNICFVHPTALLKWIDLSPLSNRKPGVELLTPGEKVKIYLDADKGRVVMDCAAS